MRHLSYVVVLVFVVLGTLPLELVLRTRVYARARRLLLTLLPVLVVFIAWDCYAIARDQWTFDPAQTLRWTLPGGLPFEELGFFLVVPVASVLTLEAVRRVRGWTVGDES